MTKPVLVKPHKKSHIEELKEYSVWIYENYKMNKMCVYIHILTAQHCKLCPYIDSKKTNQTDKYYDRWAGAACAVEYNQATSPDNISNKFKTRHMMTTNTQNTNDGTKPLL